MASSVEGIQLQKRDERKGGFLIRRPSCLKLTARPPATNYFNRPLQTLSDDVFIRADIVSSALTFYLIGYTSLLSLLTYLLTYLFTYLLAFFSRKGLYIMVFGGQYTINVAFYYQYTGMIQI